VFGHPGTLTRRISMQRSAIYNPRVKACQVIIKNTHTIKDHHETTRSALASLSRSQSLLSTHRVPILAPDRAVRVRIEHGMASVWSRELLPFPGMTASRGGHFIRARANSVMRVLSKASSTTTSSPRSVSYSSVFDSDSRPSTSGDGPTDQSEIRESLQDEYGNSAAVRSKFGRCPQTHAGGRSFSVGRGQSRVSEFSNIERDRKNRGGSDAPTIVTSGEANSASKNRKPKTLLKAFSAEGIRNLFA